MLSCDSRALYLQQRYRNGARHCWPVVQDLQRSSESTGTMLFSCSWPLRGPMSGFPTIALRASQCLTADNVAVRRYMQGALCALQARHAPSTTPADDVAGPTSPPEQRPQHPPHSASPKSTRHFTGSGSTSSDSSRFLTFATMAQPSSSSASQTASLRLGVLSLQMTAAEQQTEGSLWSGIPKVGGRPHGSVTGPAVTRAALPMCAGARRDACRGL